MELEKKSKILKYFHPERIANRILGMGDVVSLVEKASEQVDKEDAEKLQKKFLRVNFPYLIIQNNLINLLTWVVFKDS